jgi:hypothetical protein
MVRRRDGKVGADGRPSVVGCGAVPSALALLRAGRRPATAREIGQSRAADCFGNKIE